MRALALSLTVTALLAAGCAADTSALASPSASTQGTPRLPGIGTVRWARGASIALADLKLEMLASRPDAMLKIRIERGGVSSSQQGHDAGFVYQLSRTQRLLFADRAVDIQAGQAALVAPAGSAHQHEVAPGESWLFVSIGDAGRTGSSGVHGPLTYESSALAPLATGTHPGGVYTLGYTETLRRLELDPGARSPLHSTSGYEAIYVLEGAVELRAPGRVLVLAAGAGAVIEPRQSVQLVNTRSEPGRALLFFVTPGGEPYEVDFPG